jgi:HAD superfamily hydrolase (TIGR01509 family)
VPVQALLFDFDGLIVDTESPAFASWQALYARHGQQLSLDRWSATIGTIGGFDALAHLETLVGSPLEREVLQADRLAHELTLVEAEQFRPGVADYLADAERLGLRKAIVSSGSRPWIDGHLQRLERAYGWDVIVTADGDRTRAKPSPTLYLEALELLSVGAADAIAFEDSPNGIRAAKAAGIYCVGVPNSVTARLGLDEADVVVDSLASLPLSTLLERISGSVRSDAPTRS